MSVIEKILNVYAPPTCVSCLKEGASICAACIADTPKNHHSRCFMCAKWSKDFETCKKCHRKTPLRNVWVAAEYKGLVKELVHGYKYERNREAAKELAEIISETLPFLPDVKVITHVPTATSRVRARGYDHSRLLAESLARKLGKKHKTLLGRLGQSQQMGSRRKDRLKQAEGSYVAVSSAPEAVLLIDDVLTTGATLSAAAKELRRAGIRNVYAAVVAHNSNK